MKKILMLLVVLFGAIGAHAQVQPPTSMLYAWTSPTGTGQLGQYLIITNTVNIPRPGNYSLDWSLTGTAPSACTFRLEGSADAVTWYGLDTTSPSSTSCTTSNMESIAYKPVNYLRVTIVTWTTGDGTTSVIFHYTGGRS